MTESTDAPRKETPTQRVERIKREKAPWSIMDDIRRYARDGFASIPADDLGVRFRAWGLYTQGDGHGTRGEEQPFFMMRERARRVDEHGRTTWGMRSSGCISRTRGDGRGGRRCEGGARGWGTGRCWRCWRRLERRYAEGPGSAGDASVSRHRGRSPGQYRRATH